MEKKFDLKVHHRDKTGAISKVNPYRMVVSKSEGVKFIRDGVEYYADGSLVNPPKPEPKKEEKKPQPEQKPQAEVQPQAPEQKPEAKPQVQAGGEVTDLGELSDEQLEEMTEPAKAVSKKVKGKK